MTIEEMKKMKEERGYSLEQLSQYTGIPKVTLQKVFSGSTRYPRKTTMDALERVLAGREEDYPGRRYTYLTSSSGIIADGFMETGSDPDHMPLYDRLQDSVPGMMKDGSEAYITKKQGEYTLEDYYALPDERRVELIDGVFYDMSSPKIVHQDIASIVHFSIYDYIRKNKGDCKVFEAAVDVQLDCDDKTMVQPDVLVVCDRDKIKDFGIYGAPDFVLEILSPSTSRKDMSLKLYKYENAGVKEYWIINPMKKVLIICNFMEDDWIPVVMPLEGKAGMALFDGKLEIDLDEIMESIKEFG